MKKQIRLKAKESSASNSDFYNLFRPIAPSINVIGKIAQVISGLTEAVTIWYITQSEMAGASKFLSIIVSIMCMILVVALLELGGRKFLQVLTRALVWNRLKNAWYVALFSIVTLITVGMGVLSFRLSTNGVNHAFVSSVPVAKVFDDTSLKADFREQTKLINDRFNSDLKVIQDNFQGVITSTADQFDSRINAAQVKAAEYDRKFANGFKWAKSQADKYRKRMATIESEKANAILAFQNDYSKKLDQWQGKKDKALASEKAGLIAAIKKGETSMVKVQDSKLKKATFWGGLFSFFVGFSVILAFICIISVEVYRRGSGIHVEYHEEEYDQSIAKLYWEGILNRFDGFFRKKAEAFAKVKTPMVSSGRIGYNYSKALPVNSTKVEDLK